MAPAPLLSPVAEQYPKVKGVGESDSGEAVDQRVDPTAGRLVTLHTVRSLRAEVTLHYWSRDGEGAWGAKPADRGLQHPGVGRLH